MNPFTFLNRGRFILLSLFPILAFALGFNLSYQQDIIRVGEIGQLAFAHLCYAQELKDDMAVIDWSKNIEKLDGLRAFQVKVNSKVTSKGGNQDFLTSSISEGTEFVFPTNWSYRVSSNVDPQNTKEFILIYRPWPGPLLWGFLAFSSALLTGLMMELTQKRKVASSKNLAVPSVKDFTGPIPAQAPPSQSFPPKSQKDEKPFLLVDPSLLILQVSTQAAMLLDKNSDLVNKGNLIDLEPDTALVKAIQNGEETKIPKPFRGYPHLSAFVKRDTKGSQIFLETQSESTSP